MFGKIPAYEGMLFSLHPVSPKYSALTGWRQGFEMGTEALLNIYITRNESRFAGLFKLLWRAAAFGSISWAVGLEQVCDKILGIA